MMNVLILATVIAPVTMGVIEVLKQAFNLKKNCLPLLGVVFGLAIRFLAETISDIDLYLRLCAGALSGLSASGLYELTSKRDGTTNA